MTQNFSIIKFNFQDPATPVAEGIIDLHNYIIFYLIIVLVFVIAILIDLFIQNYEVYRIKKDFDLFFKCKTNFKFRRDFDLKPRYSSFFPLFAIVGFVLLAIVTQKPTVFLEIASLVMPATEVQSTNAVGHNKLFLRESSHFPAYKGPGTGLEGPVIRGGQRLAESSVSFTKSEMLNLQEFVDNIEQSSEFLVLPTTLKMEATVILRHPLALTYHSDYFFSPTSSLFIEFSRILDDPSFQFEDGSCLSFINPDIIRRPPLNPLLFLCNRFSLIDRTLSECIDPSLICRLSWSGYSKACDDWVCGFADMSVLLSNQIFFDELSSIVENIDVNCFDSVLYPKIVSDFDYLRSNLLEELKEISFEASQFCDLLPSAVQSGYSKHKAGQLFRLKFNLDRLENIEFFYHNTNLFCEEWNFFFSALQKDQPIVYPTSRTQPRITDIIYGGEVSQVVDVYKGLSLDYLTKTSSLVDVVSKDFEVMMLRNKKILFFLFVRGGAGFII